MSKSVSPEMKFFPVAFLKEHLPHLKHKEILKLRRTIAADPRAMTPFEFFEMRPSFGHFDVATQSVQYPPVPVESEPGWRYLGDGGRQRRRQQPVDVDLLAFTFAAGVTAAADDLHLAGSLHSTYSSQHGI